MQREQREKDENDDRDGKDDRPPDLDCRAQDDVQARFAVRRRQPALSAGLRSASSVSRSGRAMPRLREVAVHILDHHHAAVHHHADTDRQTAQAHQIRAETEVLHQNERQQQRQRQHGGHDQRAAHVAEEEEQDDDDEHCALEEGRLHRTHGPFHEFGLVIVRHDLHTWRERLVHFDDPELHRPDDLRGVLVDALERDAGDHLTLAVHRHGAAAHLRPDDHVGDIAHVDRRHPATSHDDVAEVVKVLGETDAANDVLFGTASDIAATDVSIVDAHGLPDVRQRDAILEHRAWVHAKLVLLDVATE